MPIEAPTRTSSGSRASSSDFVLCENFAFRPATVDGFSHQSYEDGSGVTTVNFKAYTQSVPDSDRRLFDFLISVLQPRTPDENL